MRNQRILQEIGRFCVRKNDDWWPVVNSIDVFIEILLLKTRKRTEYQGREDIVLVINPLIESHLTSE